MNWYICDREPPRNRKEQLLLQSPLNVVNYQREDIAINGEIRKGQQKLWENEKKNRKQKAAP